MRAHQWGRRRVGDGTRCHPRIGKRGLLGPAPHNEHRPLGAVLPVSIKAPSLTSKRPVLGWCLGHAQSMSTHPMLTRQGPGSADAQVLRVRSRGTTKKRDYTESPGKGEVIG